MQYFGVVITVIACIVVLLLIVNKTKQHRQKNTLSDMIDTPPTIGSEFEDDSVVVINSKIASTTNDAMPEVSPIVILHVMSKKAHVFSGYELLQALLSSGLRFGEMNIFHYYNDPQSPKDITFSLASATEPGTFDMLAMGGFSCPGLTLFMKKSDNEQDNHHRYAQMLKTARHLTEDLAGVLLNAERKPLI